MLPAIIEAAPDSHMLRPAIEVALALLALCGLAFYAIALVSARHFLRTLKRKPTSSVSPPMSILKPLKGADSETYAALRSHCVQDYAQYEILFGVNDEHDDAIPIVQSLIADFPHLDLRLIVCSEVFGANRKVSNLIHLLRQARYEHLLVNDGDIKVARGYLREIASSFSNSEVGMITCLYRGESAATLGSRLEALGIATDFIPGVLTANYLEGGLRFALGSTLAMTRTALERIGGFAAVVDYLADDYQLGERISAAGFKVVLAREVVETSVPPYSFSQFWQHQVRWARTMRVSRPLGYLGLALTFGLPWAIFLALVNPQSSRTWLFLVGLLLTRIAVALTTGRKVLGDPQIIGDLWLLPLRDLLGLAVWFWSFAGDKVSWSGERFRLEDGKMIPMQRSGQPAKSVGVEEASQPQRR